MNARIDHGAPFRSQPFEKPFKCAIQFDTAPAPIHERFALFQSWNASLVDVRLSEGDERTFEARETAWQLGDIAFVVIDASPSHLLHWEHKKKPIVDNWIVYVRETVAFNPGDHLAEPSIRVANLAAPSVCASKGRLITLFFPRGAIEASLQPEIADGPAAFFADYIRLIHGNLPALQRGSLSRLAEATTEMLAAVIAPSQERMVQAQVPIDAVITSRAIRAINLHLTDADLSPEFLCKNIGVSRSRLYRIFEPAGGISNYIRRKRLLETCRALIDDIGGHSVSHTAERFGFTDPSSFSRMFKREFGLSPKEIRELGWQGILHSCAQEDGDDDTEQTLDALLISNSLNLSLRPFQKHA